MWTVHASEARTVLLAQAKVGQFLQWDLCLAIGGMVAVVALGFWAVMKVRQWRAEAGQVGPASPQEQVDQYEKLVTDGLLEPEELARIKARLEAPPPLDVPPPKQPPDASMQAK